LFYTLFEEFKSERSYLIAMYKKPSQLRDSVKDFVCFFKHFDIRCDTILQEGIQNEELKYRRFIGDHYAKGFKLSFTYIFRVWMSDESSENQQTDAAIEKSINLAFDLLQSTSFDSILDFGRFAIKTRV
jgi:Tetracyclin repressor-like, C-terminal domain